MCLLGLSIRHQLTENRPFRFDLIIDLERLFSYVYLIQQILRE